jgi:hypothetical protein
VAKPNFLHEGPAAEYIDMSVAFLQAGRSRGTTGGRSPTPAFHKFGRRVKYNVADLDAWISTRRIDAAPRPRRVALSALSKLK